MIEPDLNRRIRASRNQPPPDLKPIEPRSHAERIGLGLMAACLLPWLPILWWIIRHG